MSKWSHIPEEEKAEITELLSLMSDDILPFIKESVDDEIEYRNTLRETQ